MSDEVSFLDLRLVLGERHETISDHLGSDLCSLLHTYTRSVLHDPVDRVKRLEGVLVVRSLLIRVEHVLPDDHTVRLVKLVLLDIRGGGSLGEPS